MKGVRIKPVDLLIWEEGEGYLGRSGGGEEKGERKIEKTIIEEHYCISACCR